jgi:hypothetical protein
MPFRNKQALTQRVVRTAEAVLAQQKYVSAIDVLTGMGLLEPVHVKNWRNGRIDSLEKVIQGRPDKISLALASLRRWATESGLEPSEVRYVRQVRGQALELRFSRRIANWSPGCLPSSGGCSPLARPERIWRLPGTRPSAAAGVSAGRPAAVIWSRIP